MLKLALKYNSAATLLILLILLPGCSFNRNWNQADLNNYPDDDISGLWEGEWNSDATGHSGSLYAIITRHSNNHYIAHFKALYALIPPLEWIPFEFKMPLRTTQSGEGHSFKGQENLGWLAGGIYYYSGEANSLEFRANYTTTSQDEGTFLLRRLQP